MAVLVTGGAGYIGSHTTIELLSGEKTSSSWTIYKLVTKRPSSEAIFTWETYGTVRF